MATGGRIEPEDIVSFELHVEIVAVLRLTSDVKEVAGRRGQFSHVDPGHDACGGAHSTELSCSDVGRVSIEREVVIIRGEDRCSGEGNGGRAGCLVGTGADLALSG